MRFESARCLPPRQRAKGKPSICYTVLCVGVRTTSRSGGKALYFCRVRSTVLYHLPVVALAVMAVAVRAQPSVSVTLNDGSAPLEVDCQPLRGGVESLSMWNKQGAWNTLVTESSSDHPKYETCQNEKIQRPELQV